MKMETKSVYSYKCLYFVVDLYKLQYISTIAQIC